MKINYLWNNEAFIYVFSVKKCPKFLRAGNMPTRKYSFCAHKTFLFFFNGVNGVVECSQNTFLEFQYLYNMSCVVMFQVHAKHEEKSDTKSVYREYNREFLLPKGTNPEAIKSSLSRDGVLTVEAPLPQLAITDRNIPIQKHWVHSLAVRHDSSYSIILLIIYFNLRFINLRGAIGDIYLESFRESQNLLTP